MKDVIDRISEERDQYMDERDTLTYEVEDLMERISALSAEIEQLTDDASSWHSKYLRQSAENSDAQAKEAFALGKLEETLKIELELRIEVTRQKHINDVHLKEHQRLFAENGAMREALEKIDRCQTENVKLSQGCIGCREAARGALERVSTAPDQNGINDRGSDEYANPESCEHSLVKSKCVECSGV